MSSKSILGGHRQLYLPHTKPQHIAFYTLPRRLLVSSILQVSMWMHYKSLRMPARSLCWLVPLPLEQ